MYLGSTGIGESQEEQKTAHNQPEYEPVGYPSKTARLGQKAHYCLVLMAWYERFGTNPGASHAGFVHIECGGILGSGAAKVWGWYTVSCPN